MDKIFGANIAVASGKWKQMVVIPLQGPGASAPGPSDYLHPDQLNSQATVTPCCREPSRQPSHGGRLPFASRSCGYAHRPVHLPEALCDTQPRAPYRRRVDPERATRSSVDTANTAGDHPRIGAETEVLPRRGYAENPASHRASARPCRCCRRDSFRRRTSRWPNPRQRS